MGDPTWITTGPGLPVPDRRFRWVAATDPVNGPALGRLEQQLAAFYAGNLDYFTLENGDFTNWTEARGPFGRIVSLTAGRRVLEVGCGLAGILRNPGVSAAGYTGCDFPADLMAENSRRFPDARFVPLKVPRRLPFADAAFDLVFSVFVLEHVVFPHLFLDECLRVCAPGGLVIVLCPDFLGRGLSSSQRLGFSPGTGREKLRRGRILDALVTAYDTRIRLRRHAARLRDAAKVSARFMINLAPRLFSDPFQIDVDAVHQTYGPEIGAWLRRGADLIGTDPETARYCRENGLLFVEARKRA
ncbi:class I SAM-dependent methyltransferase [Rhodospirillum centenum]|uniref:Methyltransferase type 11 domain-containing protein n=1 Tax=Rhodospirillum centenum (strain ATCC 51521 / SW) TaxID=414684 RepID=B6IYI6_RHOCS|nr:class I SAM-dependent methyltransferase [Rhodospirillum centenum]ACJ01360.1 hypothetical protein RC1_4019 [Rhodospirillum centenum SW]